VLHILWSKSTRWLAWPVATTWAMVAGRSAHSASSWTSGRTSLGFIVFTIDMPCRRWHGVIEHRHVLSVSHAVRSLTRRATNMRGVKGRVRLGVHVCRWCSCVGQHAHPGRPPRTAHTICSAASRRLYGIPTARCLTLEASHEVLWGMLWGTESGDSEPQGQLGAPGSVVRAWPERVQ